MARRELNPCMYCGLPLTINAGRYVSAVGLPRSNRGRCRKNLEAGRQHHPRVDLTDLDEVREFLSID